MLSFWLTSTTFVVFSLIVVLTHLRRRFIRQDEHNLQVWDQYFQSIRKDNAVTEPEVTNEEVVDEESTEETEDLGPRATEAEESVTEDLRRPQDPADTQDIRFHADEVEDEVSADDEAETEAADEQPESEEDLFA